MSGTASSRWSASEKSCAVLISAEPLTWQRLASALRKRRASA